MLVKLARDCAENKNIPQIANALIINAKRNSNMKILLDAVNAAVLLHLMASTLKPNNRISETINPISKFPLVLERQATRVLLAYIVKNLAKLDLAKDK
ncbi:hypothetical protein HDU99_001851, partial [Rhizoclosmatium hyalinum]